MIKLFKTGFVIFLFIVSTNAHRKYRPDPSFAFLTNVNPGRIATRGEFPWVVSFRASVALFCSGSLIDTNWVLTAAQCVPIPSASYDVTLGGTNSAVSEIERVIVKTSLAIVHPNFVASTLSNDVALLKLESSPLLSAYVKPIRLPRMSDASTSYIGAKTTISGWGYTRSEKRHKKVYTERTVGNSLYWMDAAIITNTECQSKLSNKSITMLQMCSYIPGKTNCIGDVGAPLVYIEDDNLPTQIGVTSFYNIKCPINAVMTHTKITSVLSWIYLTSGLPERQ